MQKAKLVLLTTILILIGVVLLTLVVTEYKNRKECGEQECSCSRCVCRDGEYICAIKQNDPEEEDNQDEKVRPIKQESFSTRNLQYDSEFVSFPVSHDITTSPVQTALKNVSYVNNVLDVSFLQKQICNVSEGDTSKGEVPGQAGFYYIRKNNLILYNVVNPLNQDTGRSCTARIKFRIEDFKMDELQDFSLYYQSESRRLEEFPVCVYHDKVFMQDDIYEAKDNCNTCVCKEGENVCSADKKCIQDESRTASVYRDYPNYEVYEYPERDNECASSSQCYTGGCQSEICSPVNGKMSDCSVAVDMKSDIECKCVKNKCVWVE